MIHSTLTIALLGVGLLSRSALAHSWIRCTDYRVENPGQPEPLGRADPDPARYVYNDSLCEGYSPSFPSRSLPFGEDRGLNSLPQNEEQYCPSRANVYKQDMPMARYSPGQSVCLAYPAKNHVAANCNQPGDIGYNNLNIPDGCVRIFRSPVNPSFNDFPNLATFEQNEYEHLNGEHQLGTEDYRGFQNCPDFCSPPTTDRVLCTMCFNLEDDLATGEYHFLWEWEFNTGEIYTTCWSAEVSGEAVSTEITSTPVATAPPLTTEATTRTTTPVVTESPMTTEEESCPISAELDELRDLVLALTAQVSLLSQHVILLSQHVISQSS